MANMIEMMKQMKEIKKLQKQLAKSSVEASSRDGLITVTANGELSVTSIKLDPELLDKSQAGQLERALVSTVNAALDASKKAAAADMTKLTGGLGGLSGLMGG